MFVELTFKINTISDEEAEIKVEEIMEEYSSTLEELKDK